VQRHRCIAPPTREVKARCQFVSPPRRVAIEHFLTKNPILSEIKFNIGVKLEWNSASYAEFFAVLNCGSVYVVVLGSDI
jgi:hypothetical protein